MRFLPAFLAARRGAGKVATLFALYFVVACAVGMLRPVKNALALDGLGDALFYRVYLVSGLVVAFVPLYDRLARRFSWRWLFPGMALFFAANLLLFRLLYREGSAAFGLAFYGWADLFAAVLVAQFFMVTQLFFDARDAKRAYPLVIAGGSLGATVGGALTALLAGRLGTPNLLWVAAALVAAFGLCLPLVWMVAPADAEMPSTPRPSSRDVRPSARDVRSRRGDAGAREGWRDLWADPHLRLIAAGVLLAVLVKQLVDYQFNAMSDRAFVTRDAIGAFQGTFFAATQWLPIVVLAGLRPLLRRHGVGIVLLLLPAAVLLANVGMVLWFGIWAAAAAKGVETTFRYSAERTGREILYVPVPEGRKLRAKAYIDVALEKGAGKVVAALVIFGVLGVLGDRSLPWATMAAAAGLLAVGVAARREYVRSLARAIQGRFASLEGIFATVGEASALPLLRRALGEGNRARLAFVLDLLGQADPEDLKPLAPELAGLLEHPAPEIRARALEVAGRVPGADPDRIRGCLADPASAVRESAVRALFRLEGPSALADLLRSGDGPVRVAALFCLAREEVPADVAASLARPLLKLLRAEGEGRSPDRRLQLALAAAAVARREPEAGNLPPTIRDDPDPRVASAAVWASARAAAPDPAPRAVLDALARPETREAARETLARGGITAVPLLEARLRDPEELPSVRRHLPSVLARVPDPSAADALLRTAADPGVDRLVARRALAALNKRRARAPSLDLPESAARSIVERAAVAGRRYAASLAHMAHEESEPGPAGRLLERALREARADRREVAFRALALVHPPDQVYRCYLAITGGHPRARAAALEWLERTAGRRWFGRLAPLLEGGEAPHPDVARETWRRLPEDEDPWVARCAEASRAVHDGTKGSPRMELLEKVFLLQNVDLLRDVKSEVLARLASIAEEVTADPGSLLLRRGEPTGALFVLMEGAVELKGVAGDPVTLGPEAAFGTWALIDEEPSLVEGRATARSRLLRISRRDFLDLLAEHGEVSQELLKGLARRVRELARRVTEPGST